MHEGQVRVPRRVSDAFEVTVLSAIVIGLDCPDGVYIRSRAVISRAAAITLLADSRAARHFTDAADGVRAVIGVNDAQAFILRRDFEVTMLAA